MKNDNINKGILRGEIYEENSGKEGSGVDLNRGGSTQSPIKGGQIDTMTTTITTTNTQEKLFIRDIVGMRTLRSNLSECVSRAINNFQEVVTANTAVKGGKTASIISTDMLKMMLDSCIKFNTSVIFDESTKQYVASVIELDADGQGDTKEEAIEVLLDNIVTLTEDYFENIELYLRVDNSRRMLPYFERIRHCGSMDDMIKVLGLDV